MENEYINNIFSKIAHNVNDKVLEICFQNQSRINCSTKHYISDNIKVIDIPSNSYDIIVDFSNRIDLYKEYIRIAQKTVYINNVSNLIIDINPNTNYKIYENKYMIICIRPINIYTDMVADLFHTGHVNFLRKCKNYLPCVKLTVGIHSDADISKNKRNPICNIYERCAVVESCKYVDEIVFESPYAPYSDELILKYDLFMYTKKITEEKKIEWFGNIILLNKFIDIPYTDGISTTEIIERILNLNQKSV